MFTRRPCCRMARCWSQEAFVPADILSAPNCTTRPAELGLQRAASTPHALFLHDAFRILARYLLRAEVVTAAIWPAPNCTTRPVVLGVQRAASTPHANSTRRACC